MSSTKININQQPSVLQTTLTGIGFNISSSVTSSNSLISGIGKLQSQLNSIPTGSGGSTTWGSITGSLSNQTDLQTILNKKATFDYYNIKDYGAIGNGISDDSIAIQNAINAASVNSGSTVIFPTGVYLAAGLNYNPSVNLKGVGNGTIIKAKSSGTLFSYTGSGIVYNNASGEISDITFEGNNTGSIAFDMTAVYLLEWNRVNIQNFTNVGIKLTSCVSHVFNKLNIENCNTGVILAWTSFYLQSNLNTFNQCHINQNATWAITMDQCAGIFFNDCDFELNGTNNNLNTGCIKTTNMCPNGEGIAICLEGSWFERNYGTAIQLNTLSTSSIPNQTRSVISNTILQYPQSGSTQGVKLIQSGSISNAIQYLVIEKSTITGHTTDVITDTSGSTLIDISSKINIHNETNSGSYGYNSPSYSFSSLTGKPTTIAGYGITDALRTWVPQTGISTLLSGSVGITGSVYAQGYIHSDTYIQAAGYLTGNQIYANSKGGTSAVAGTRTLISGSVTFTNYLINASLINSDQPIIMLTYNSIIGSPGYLIYSTSLNNLTITSKKFSDGTTNTSDNSTVNFLVIN